ncbi:hypothetical protein ACS5PN_27880 [Roseateles sp. NT4]|uniref:hypothetical protein n=1 Tax=Roseateles sp. NT4 TaxID=3453715 RepID=UPI003EE84BB6
MPMQLNEFFASPAIVGSTDISLEGVFVVAHGRAYLVPSMEAKDDLSRSVVMDYELLKPLLLSKVPAFGGGPYLYCDQAVVEGTLSLSEEGAEAQFVFRDVLSFSLTRRGHAFQVVP